MKTEKYLPLPEVFDQKGYKLTKVYDFGDGWMIYKRVKENRKFIEWELVKPKKQKEFNIAGNTIPAKIAYPNETSDWGRIGFSLVSLERAKEKHKEIKNEEVEYNQETKIELPLKNKEFTIKDLIKKYPNYSYSKIYIFISELLEKKKIKITGEIKNKKGRSTKIYKTL